jgi:hypothetical protein
MTLHQLIRYLISSRSTRIAIIAILILGFVGIAHGQSITGILIGTVTDQQGAVISSATIKATNVDTGVAHATISNEQGEFRIEFLTVGNYVVEVKATSFKTFIQQNIPVLADQSQRVDAALQAGATDETVMVTSAPTRS